MHIQSQSLYSQSIQQFPENLQLSNISLSSMNDGSVVDKILQLLKVGAPLHIKLIVSFKHLQESFCVVEKRSTPPVSLSNPNRSRVVKNIAFRGVELFPQQIQEPLIEVSHRLLQDLRLAEICERLGPQVDQLVVILFIPLSDQPSS